MTVQPIKVLAIEDELGMRQLLVYELSAKGFLVETATDGVDGLAKLARQPFDAVITDLKMPRLGGLETLRSIKSASPDTHVIMISAHGTVATAVAAMKHGAFDFVQKPFDVDHIARLIESAVRRRRLEAVGAVHEAARRLAQEAGGTEVLELICGLVLRQLEGSKVALLVERRGEVKVEAHAGTLTAAWRDWAAEAAREAASAPASWVSNSAALGGCRAGAAVALRGMPGGALVIARSAAAAFGPTDLRLLDLFAAQLSLALRARETSEALAEAEASLTRAEGIGSIATLAAGVAHEIGNGLACMLGYAQVMGEEPALSDLQREGLEVLKRQIERCSVLCDDLRNLGRGRQTDAAPFPLFAPLHAALRLARFELTTGGVKVTTHPGAPEAVVSGCSAELQQVFLNLIRNAIAAMDGVGGERRLEAWVGTREGRAVARLADTGPGIPPAVRARLFEPFFTTKGRAGTGLGLYLCAGIARRHGGSLTLEDAPGGGTVAVLELPLAAR